MRIAFIITVLILLTSVTAAYAAQSAQQPGFACRVLAARQPVPGTTVTDFRVVKLTFASQTVGALHRHKYGEILYLLSGSGTSTSQDGTVTPLSTDRALVIPPNIYHKVTPTGTAALSVLSVQFPERRAASYDSRPSGPDQCKA